MPGGRLLIAGYSLGDVGGLHVLDRDGAPVRSFAAPPAVPQVWAFERSLLGGYIARGSDWFVYSIRSPYEIRFFSLDQRPTYRCVGAPDWTTRPEDVVRETGNRARLEYGKFVHSARILTLTDSLVLNVIFDPVQGSRILDVLTRTCEWLRRETVDVPVMFTDVRNGYALAVQNVQYPEVIKYRLVLKRAHPGPN
jgi:hypothetical protein